MAKHGNHVDLRCEECQKAEPVVRPLVMKIWYCARCSSVLCEHTAIEPTNYGNAYCAECAPKRK